MAKKEEKKALVEVPEVALPVAVDTALLGEMESSAGAGLEHVTAADCSIPFLSIVQANSPERTLGEKYIQGANDGAIFNSVTRTLYTGPDGSPGVTVVPVSTRHVYAEFVARAAGGGFVAQHERGPGSAMYATAVLDPATRKRILPNGNEIVETQLYYALAITDTIQPVCIAMKSTQLSFARRWNYVIAGKQLPSANGGFYTPPLWAFAYRFTTAIQTRVGKSFYGWSCPNLEGENVVYAFPERARYIIGTAQALFSSIARGERSASFDGVGNDDDAQAESTVY